jgi:hypothetical protein
MIGAMPLKKGRLTLRHLSLFAVRYLSLFVSCIVILPGSPGQANAEPYRFQTSARNIFCQINYQGLSCDLVVIHGNRTETTCRQEDCDELRFFLPQTGQAFALPRSDSMALFTKNTISAGMRLKAGSIICYIFNDSLSCANSSDGSLLLKRSAYALNVKSHSVIPTSNDSP